MRSCVGFYIRLLINWSFGILPENSFSLYERVKCRFSHRNASLKQTSVSAHVYSRYTVRTNKWKSEIKH